MKLEPRKLIMWGGGLVLVTTGTAYAIQGTDSPQVTETTLPPSVVTVAPTTVPAPIPAPEPVPTTVTSPPVTLEQDMAPPPDWVPPDYPTGYTFECNADDTRWWINPDDGFVVESSECSFLNSGVPADQILTADPREAG